STFSLHREIIEADEADELAVGRCDDIAPQLALAHPLDQRLGADARAHRARARRHRLLDRLVVVGGDRLAAKAPEHDPMLVDKDAGPQAARPPALAHLTHPAAQGAGRHAAMRTTAR